MVGPRNERVRESLFWVGAVLLAVLVVAMDRVVAFVYLPRWLLVLPTILLMFPSRVNRTYWVRAALAVLLAALPFALAPVRWNLRKSFYVDCESLEAGMPWAEALDRMSGYVRNPPGRSHTTFLPSREHSADWCVLYPEGDRLARVWISPD